MRTPIVAGNWKMNTTYDEAMDLIEALVDGWEETEPADRVEVVLCPPALWLVSAAEYTEDSGLLLGAQHCHWEAKGAYTGEISPAMLADRCSYVIVGHSERRQHFGATDEDVARTVLALLEQGLRPIICVGENLDQRDGGKTDDVVTLQVNGAIAQVPSGKITECVFAYEPVWAIGTGRAATATEANRVSALIRSVVERKFGRDNADRVRVQYGGSVTAANAAELLAQPDIDGALVGGASLKAAEFLRICEIAAEHATDEAGV